MSNDNQPPTDQVDEHLEEQYNNITDINRRMVLKAAGMTGAGLAGLGAFSGSAAATIGDDLGTIDLDDSTEGVGLTFTGQYVIVPDGFSTDTLDIYEPVQSGSAPLVASKTVTDTSDNPLRLNSIAWDPTRSMLWGADSRSGGPVYLIDIGDFTVSNTVQGTHEFDAKHPQGTFIDGLALDVRSDTLFYSPDVRPLVREYNLDGSTASDVVPELPNGDQIGNVSGLAIGTDLNGRRTLYVGENQHRTNGSIHRVYADDGTHISEFAVATEIRVEDITCNPLTYAPAESILVKHAYAKGQSRSSGETPTVYRAFEVEQGTCPLPGEGACPPTTVNLIADGGSTATAVTIGTVTVEEDGDNINVTYSLTDDWFLRETHLHVAGDADEDGNGDCDRIPQTRSGNPNIGNFALSRDYGPGVQEDGYVIAQTDNAFGEEFSEGEALCVAAHASVFQDGNDNQTFDPNVDREETAWGEGPRFTERGSWAMHFDYEVCD